MKNELHQRNKHKNGYDFDLLKENHPKLTSHIVKSPVGNDTIDFSNPKSVKILNTALLKAHYNIEYWDIPDGFLCPPIPGRVDYIHNIADLLFGKNEPIRGKKIKGLDVGTGSNLIYPLLGNAEYGWRFVGSEINMQSIDWAKQIIDKNEHIGKEIKIRRQKYINSIFLDLIKSDEQFDFTMCNPPFHKSAKEAEHSNATKSRKLNIKSSLNFGGMATELWCEGGEFAFVKKMLIESEKVQTKVLWFTSLISKNDTLKKLDPVFSKNKKIKQFKIVEMAQGQKISRFVAWSFQTEKQMKAWKTKWK